VQERPVNQGFLPSPRKRRAIEVTSSTIIHAPRFAVRERHQLTIMGSFDCSITPSEAIARWRLDRDGNPQKARFEIRKP
jgi:hypothetical protein